MKVLNLQCGHGHSFEGWFASEDDFQGQLSRGVLECPMCGNTGVIKMPSAPRLNLSGATAGAPNSMPTVGTSSSGAPGGGGAPSSDVAALPPALQAAWLQMARRLLAQTEDVGDRFADEARRIHYGEADERAIRGQATRDQTEELLDEGIAVLPLPIPDGFNGPLQ